MKFAAHHAARNSRLRIIDITQTDAVHSYGNIRRENFYRKFDGGRLCHSTSACENYSDLFIYRAAQRSRVASARVNGADIGGNITDAREAHKWSPEYRHRCFAVN
jgi:hypothetical protein